METQEKKSNTQLLKEIQDIADNISHKKQEVEILLNIIDNLEKTYYLKIQEVKNNQSRT